MLLQGYLSVMRAFDHRRKYCQILSGDEGIGHGFNSADFTALYVGVVSNLTTSVERFGFDVLEETSRGDYAGFVKRLLY